MVRLVDGNIEREVREENKIPFSNTLTVIGALATAVPLVVYIGTGVVTSDWSITNFKTYLGIINEGLKRKAYEQKVDSTYNALFNEAKSLDDSLKIYEKYGLPIKLELKKPSFEDKERAVKENELEKSLK